jgi:hypothetical protein
MSRRLLRHDDAAAGFDHDLVQQLDQRVDASTEGAGVLVMVGWVERKRNPTPIKNGCEFGGSRFA